MLREPRRNVLKSRRIGAESGMTRFESWVSDAARWQSHHELNMVHAKYISHTHTARTRLAELTPVATHQHSNLGHMPQRVAGER